LKILFFNPPLYADKYYTEAEECCFGMAGKPVVPHNLLRIASTISNFRVKATFKDYAIENKTWPDVLTDLEDYNLAFTPILHGGTAHNRYLAYYEPLHHNKKVVALCYPDAIAPEVYQYLRLDYDASLRLMHQWIPRFNGNSQINYSLYPYHNTAGKVYVVQAGTGCKYNCNFCVWAGKKYQLRPVDDVINQLSHIDRVRAPRDEIFLLSSQITSDPEWLQRFVEEKTKWLPNIRFYGDIGVGEVTEAIASLLKKSGIMNATVGAEALSDGWLRKFRKPWTYDSIKRGLLALQKADVTYHLILRCGIGETQADIAESIRNLVELNNLGVKPDYVQWGKIYPYPGTDISTLEGKQEFLPELKLYVDWLKDLGWIKR